MLKNNHQRIQWVDIAKGIAIILMVLGHSSIPRQLGHWIFSFHMPLFFIASGFTTRWEKHNFAKFIHNKYTSILLPFTIYSLIVITGATYARIDIGWAMKSGWGGYAMWFIPVLLAALLITKLILLFRKKIQYLLVSCFIVIDVLLCRNNISLPWNLSVVPLATFFIFLGSQVRPYRDYIEQQSWLWGLGALIISIVVSTFWHLDMAWNHIVPIIPIIIGAIAGTLFIVFISRLIEKYFKSISQILQAIGRETYMILAFSQVIIMGINRYCSINVLVKYILLIAILVVAKYIKDFVKSKTFKIS